MWEVIKGPKEVEGPSSTTEVVEYFWRLCVVLAEVVETLTNCEDEILPDTKKYRVEWKRQAKSKRMSWMDLVC